MSSSGGPAAGAGRGSCCIRSPVRTYELAPYGPSKLWLDDRLLLSIDESPAGILGKGVKVPLALAPGEHRITLLTCPGAGNRSGFYLLEL